MSHDQGHNGAEHAIDHTGHEDAFRRRFWVCPALTFPVLFWSATIQDWLGYSAPTFTAPT